MTKDDIIKLAREAAHTYMCSRENPASSSFTFDEDGLKRFANLAAAAELRRLHEVEKQRDELLEALKAQLAVTDWHEQEGANELARAAINKAERTTT